MKNRRVCIVNTPTLFKRPLSRSMAGGLGFDGNESMTLPPLDLAILASSLRSKGHEVTIMDADPLQMDDEKVLSLIREGNYSTAIATLSLPTLNNDCEFIARLCGLADTVIVKTMIRQKEILREILQKSKANLIVHGECDLRIHEIIGGASTSGTAFIRDGKLIVEHAEPAEDLNLLPIPSWDLLPYDKYTYPLLGNGVMTMQTSRGCPFPCSYYCPYPLVEGKAWRSQSPERVYLEMEQIVSKYGIKKILFRDATFTLNKERVHKICDLIISGQLDVKWWCETRVDCLDDELLEKMKRAGCAGMNVGVETGDQKVMESQAKKGLTIEKLIQLRERAKALDIRLHFLLSKGFPGETRKSFVDTYELIMKLRPESLGITIMTPYPGTQLYRDAEARGWIESKEWGDYGGHQFVMRTDNLSREDFLYGVKFLHMANSLLQKRHDGADPYKIRKIEKELYTELLIWATGLEDLRERLSRFRVCRGEGLNPSSCLSGGNGAGEHRFKMSIIIPTCNRKEHLLKCLNSLSEQRFEFSRFEVIVVDDGSIDGTGEAVKKLNHPFKLRYYYQENAGPASARNRGVTLAENEIVAFIGDDIMALPDFVRAHLETHTENPDPQVAVLGHIDWPPEFHITPLMEYITGPGGEQFNFTHIRNRENAGFNRFYTSNISLKKSFLLEERGLFDTDFEYAACEDVELGYRLSRRGLRIIYNPMALSYHFHKMDLESFEKREEKVGEMLVVLGKKHHELVDVNSYLKNQDEISEYQFHKNDILKMAEDLESKYFKLNELAVNGINLGDKLAREVLNPLYKYIFEKARGTGFLRKYKTENREDSNSAAGNPTVSVIIPVHNKVEYTKRCLEALASNTLNPALPSFNGRGKGGFSYEVIIIDNGSTDGTKDFLNCLEGDVRVMANETNLGFAKACNQGAKAARGNYLVFLNNDTIAQEGWLENLIKVVEERQDVAIVGSKLLYPDGKVQHAGVVFGERERGYGIYHIYRGIEKDHPAVNRMRELSAVTAACMLVRKKTFIEEGMFDEGYINGYEDIDLCLKFREKGYKIIYNPASVLIHYEGMTDGRLSYAEHNTRYFLKRWNGKIKSDEQCIAAEDGFKVESLRDGALRYHCIGREVNEDITPMRRDMEKGKLSEKKNAKKIAIIRGANLNKWEMQNYEPLSDVFDITAYTTEETRFDISKISLPVVKLPFQSQGLLLHMQGLEDHLADKDLIYSADITYQFSAQAVQAKKKYGCKVVCLEWENVPFNFEEHEAVRTIKESVRREADHFIAVTGRAKEALILEGVPGEKVDVIPMGIDLGRFKPDAEDCLRYREQLGIGRDEIVILFIGRMVWEKGVYDFIHAASGICRDSRLNKTPLRFLMVGKGPELEGVRARAEALGISPWITIIEDFPYHQMHRLHNLADIFVLPSISTKTWQEQFGMVLIESMACGKPVISTLSGSIPEVVGDAGILVQPNDHISLYEAMRRLITDRDARENFGRAALERAEKEFNSAGTAERVRKVFEKILSRETTEGHIRDIYKKGLQRWEEGDRETGFQLICNAFDENPDNKEILDSLAAMGKEMSRPEEVENKLREYLNYHPADLDALVALAETLLSMGKRTQADEELQKVFLFDPENRKAAALMQVSSW